METPSVTMTCMTRKEKFEVQDPEVVMLKNGRYAYKARCPWEGKNGKELFAYKFCSKAAYMDKHQEQAEAPEEPDDTAE